jgi:hypothetical protein
MPFQKGGVNREFPPPFFDGKEGQEASDHHGNQFNP